LKLLGADMATYGTRDSMTRPDDRVAGPDEPRHRQRRASRAISFDQFYRQEYRTAVTMAYGLSGSRTAAEEIAQEAFLAAHRRWSRICDYDEPGLWLRRVVVNRSVSAVRRRIAEARAMTRLGARPHLPHVLPEQHEELWRAVRRLPAQQAKAVVLHYVDDCSVAEIASILDCSQGTVKTHLHRARRALADALGEPGARRTQ
jgi:RNA polymerase sigma-70 factor (sigma-E family)